MSTISTLRNQLVAYGYSNAIIQYIILYVNGDEGIPTHDQLTDDNAGLIAEEYKTEHPPSRGIPVQYFDLQNPIGTRRQFCMIMKNPHNFSTGAAIKMHSYLSKIRAQPEGTNSNANVHGDAFGIDPQQKGVKETELIISKRTVEIHGNIFIAKQLLKHLDGLIEEEFGNDISSALQINDDQMVEFTILKNNEEIKLCIIDYGLHFKGTDNILYGIITPNVNDEGFSWKLSQYMTGNEVYNKFDIKSSALPPGSLRKLESVKEQDINK